MLLDPHDAELYFRLHRTALHYANRQLRVLSGRIDTPEDLSRQPLEDRLLLRDALTANPQVLDQFVRENPFGLPDDELEIVGSWRHLVAAKLILLRQLKKHAIFLTTADPPVAYGVVALAETLEEILQRPLPALADAVLLPFRGQIIYDGLLNGYTLSFGPGIRRDFDDRYRAAKERFGIVTSLPFTPASQHEGCAKPAAPAERRVSPPPRRQQTRSTQPRNPFTGRWQIESLSPWDPDDLDADGPAWFQFRTGGLGSFRLGTVQGEIDYRLTRRDDHPAIEFSWQGSDEDGDLSGRGWAVAVDRRLEGMFYFHAGEETAFRCIRRTRQRPRRRKQQPA